MSAADDIVTAQRREAAARAQLIATLKALQFRLSPKTLAREGVQRVADAGQDVALRVADASQQAVQTGTVAVRRHPGPTAAAAAAALLFLARHRIARVFRRKPNPSSAKDAIHD